MKAMQVNTADQGPRLILVELQKPEAGKRELIVVATMISRMVGPLCFQIERSFST
jgi:hypothetical protein